MTAHDCGGERVSPIRVVTPSRAIRVGLLALTTVALTSCFEEPVMQRLHLRFTADGSYEVQVTTRIARMGDEEKNPALARRLRDMRLAFEQGFDPWSSRFALLDPEFERIILERDHGLLVGVERSAGGSDDDALLRFLGDAGLSASLVVHGTEAELQIIPGAAGGGATGAQRDRVDALVQSWSTATARTYQAVARLYRYLQDHPEHARTCLAAVFSEALSEPERTEGEELASEDRGLVSAVQEARREVLEIFDVPPDEAYSPNELSHLVFDPFPARFSLSLPSEGREVEGFTRGPDGTLLVGGLGLFEALEALAGRWALPDPVVDLIQAARAGSARKLTLDELVAMPRRASSPTVAEVREGLERQLRPAPYYRVVFTLAAVTANRLE